MQVYHDIEQGTPEWFAVRAGIPTASMYATVMANGRGGSASKTRMEYMLKLAGERITGEPMQNFSNRHMQRGHEMEPQARDAYAFLTDNEPEQVGFIRNGDTGASPDSLVGESGLLEIKTKLPHLQLAVIRGKEIPQEHLPQVQGQLWVAEREWCDFVSFWPGMRAFIKRAYRDEELIAKIAAAVRQFNEELQKVLEEYEAEGYEIAAPTEPTETAEVSNLF